MQDIVVVVVSSSSLEAIILFVYIDEDRFSRGVRSVVAPLSSVGCTWTRCLVFRPNVPWRATENSEENNRLNRMSDRSGVDERLRHLVT